MESVLEEISGDELVRKVKIKHMASGEHTVLTTAVGEGTIAALSAAEYIRTH